MNAAGGPEVLEAANIATPALTDPFSVLVRLHAAGVNPIDTKVRKNNMYYPDKLPSILGCDGAGVVEAVGKSVTRVRPGDEVLFLQQWSRRATRYLCRVYGGTGRLSGI